MYYPKAYAHQHAHTHTDKAQLRQRDTQTESPGVLCSVSFSVAITRRVGDG